MLKEVRYSSQISVFHVRITVFGVYSMIYEFDHFNMRSFLHKGIYIYLMFFVKKSEMSSTQWFLHTENRSICCGVIRL